MADLRNTWLKKQEPIMRTLDKPSVLCFCLITVKGTELDWKAAEAPGTKVPGAGAGIALS